MGGLMPHKHSEPSKEMSEAAKKSASLWDESFCELPQTNGAVDCPHCSHPVNLGTAGIRNLKRHLGSGACKKNQEKNLRSIKTLRKPIPEKKQSGLLNFLRPKPSLIPPTVRQPTIIHPKPHYEGTQISASSSRSYSLESPPISSPSISVSNADNSAQKQNEDPAASPSSSSGSKPNFEVLLSEIEGLIPGIQPASTSVGECVSLIFAQNHPGRIEKLLRGPPARTADDLWEEVINRELHDVFQGKTTQQISETICQVGRHGLQNFCTFVRSCVHGAKMGGPAFEPRLEKLCEALKASNRPAVHSTSTQPPVAEAATETHNPNAGLPHMHQAEDHISTIQGVDSDSDDDVVEIISPGPQVRKPDGISITISRPRHRQCQGYTFCCPEGCNPYGEYPFALHCQKELPWYIGKILPPTITFYSKSCKGETTSPGKLNAAGECSSCSSLRLNGFLCGVISRLGNPIHENTPLAYHGNQSLILIVQLRNKQLDSLRLGRLNDLKKLVVATRRVDDHKRLTWAIAKGDNVGVLRCIRVGIENKCGVTRILQMVNDAIDGIYKPRCSEDTWALRGLVLMRLGGNQLADFAYRSGLGVPSRSTLNRRSQMIPIKMSIGFPTVNELDSNIDACFSAGLKEQLQEDRGQPVWHVVLMFDEIATEKRLRWDHSTNGFAGIARETAHLVNTSFDSEDDLEVLAEALEKGSVDYASEATCGAFSILNGAKRLSSARPFLISGTNKREDSERHAGLINKCYLTLGQAAERLGVRLRVVSLATDGETKRGVSMNMITLRYTLSEASPIYSQLANLEYANLQVGKDDITADKDYRHVIKRIRNCLLRQQGIAVLGQILTPDIFKLHLRDEGHSAEHVSYLYNPNDKQDVTLAYRLVRDIWSLPATTQSEKIGYQSARDAIYLLGRFFKLLIFPYICVDLTLAEQLQSLSAAAKLALLLYRHSGSQFLPTLLYLDIQIMIKNVIISFAKAKVDNPDSKFYIILLGTNALETLFGIIRTMVGNDSNVDILQLAHRITGTTEVANILAKYPEWDQSKRRLKLPIVSRDGKVIEENMEQADHVNPYSWKGDVSVHSVSLLTCWRKADQLIKTEMAFSHERSQEIDDLVVKLKEDSLKQARDQPINVLAPFGKLLCSLGKGNSDEELDTGEEDLDEQTSPTVPGSRRDGNEFSQNTAPANILLGGGLSRELEDAAVEEGLLEDNGTSGKSHSHAGFVISSATGQKINKGRLVTQRMAYDKTVGSTDRLKRCQGGSRYDPGDSDEQQGGSSSETSTNPDGDATVVVNDPVATIVSCGDDEDFYFLCVGDILRIEHQGRPQEQLPKDLLTDDTTWVSIQIVILVPATNEDDTTGAHDWRSRTSASAPMRIRAPGRLIEVLCPDIALPSQSPSSPSTNKKGFYLFESRSLLLLANELIANIRAFPRLRKQLPQVKQTEYFPYREATGKGCFQCDMSPLAKMLEGVMDPMCGRCPVTTVGQKKTQARTILTHIAAHILFDPSIDRSSQPCGTCLSPAPACIYQLKKGSGRRGHTAIDTQASSTARCKNFQRFNLASASQHTKAAPSTNSLMNCPCCPPKSPAIWKYNLRAHLIKSHPSVDPDAHKDLWGITPREESELQYIWENRLKVKRVQKKGKTDKLTVSEAHRAITLQDRVDEPNTPVPVLDDESDGDGDGDDDGDEPSESESSDDDDENDADRVPEEPGSLPPTEPAQRSDDSEPTAAIDSAIETRSSPAAEEAQNDVDEEPASSPDVSTSNPGPRRTGLRKRTHAEAVAMQCDCGDVVDPEEREDVDAVIQCNQGGCETIWYHIRCLKDAGQLGKGWVCSDCKRSRKRVRRGGK